MIAIGADRFRSRAAVSPESGTGSGGQMDDFSKRLSAVEVGVAEIRAQLPHLATKADVHALRSDMNAMETRILKWMVGTVISGMALAVTLAVGIAQILSHFVSVR